MNILLATDNNNNMRAHNTITGDQTSLRLVQNHAEAGVRIGQILIDRNIISRDSLEVALVEQKQAIGTGQIDDSSAEWALVEIIARLSICEHGQLCQALGDQLNVGTVDLDQLTGNKDNSQRPDSLEAALELAQAHNISADWMRRAQFLPFSYEAKCLLVAMSQPQDLELIDALRECLPTELSLRPHLALSGDIIQAIGRLGFSGTDPRHQVRQLGEQLEASSDDNRQHQILVEMIDKLLEAALFEHASDIHFAPSKKTLRVLFRVDGVLQLRYRIHPRFASAVSVRIKVLAKLDISETRLPQDGNCQATINGTECDVRISTLPTQYGESVVMRLHGRNMRRCDIDKSGLPPTTVVRLRHLLRRPHGLMLIAGPTGSGKSSTLYAMIKSLNCKEKNVISIEDPIEYSLGETIRQTGVNETIGLSFAHALRSTLRQDPDVIMIGEIRDQETAQMSLRMAMTGHLVLATVHCDSALSVHLRLRLLGLEPELFADQLIACMAQRLTRQACSHCRYVRPRETGDNLDGEDFANVTDVLDVRGCERCDHSGYRGRKPIMELLEVNTGIAELIANHASRQQIGAAAERSGFVSIQSQAMRAVAGRVLTPAEAIRVAG